MPVLFALTQFASAFLLFLVQPIIGKMVLPILGGTAAVWNTSMVFFQTSMLGGYAYAHLSVRLGPRRQSILHTALLAQAFWFIPFSINEKTLHLLSVQPHEIPPSIWLLAALTLTVGIPLFVLAGSGPMIQKWFSATGHRESRDPYFLYAAGNVGSMLALVSYPVLVEPLLTLGQQASLWAVGYAVLGALMLGCALFLFRRNLPQDNARAEFEESEAIEAVPEHQIHSCRLERAHWIVLALGPSSLMLGVTGYLTTDIVSIPLLWMLPLILYLLTFVFAFARREWIPHRWLCRILPMAALFLVLCLLWEATRPTWLLLPLHLLTFFIAAMVCHRELARRRPEVSRLTLYYLCISAGGLLGGVLSALIAPLIFNAMFEYPLSLVLCCCLCPSRKPEHAHGSESGRESLSFLSRLSHELVPSLLLGLFAVVLILVMQSIWTEPGEVLRRLVYALPALICFLFVDRSVRFGAGLCSLILAGQFYVGRHGSVIHQERNFFGVLRVTESPDGRFRRLVHGSTLHGQQFLEPSRSHEPLAYYHQTGPIGRAFAGLSAHYPQCKVAVVGLGIGSMAFYAKEGQVWDFYEIDPAVEAIARKTEYFTFIEKSEAKKANIIIGDARLRLQDAGEHSYQLMLLDAFSSDAIPLHLLTREALGLYQHKLDESGIILFHTSNRYLDLAPILKKLADDAGLICRIREDFDVDDSSELYLGKTPSVCVAMARHEAVIHQFTEGGPSWLEIELEGKNPPLWTDDYSNILSAFRW
ncbi:MAG: fused MFS/spermidine synthase [Planctomycetota bacterium]|nr:fused MFS/spermidine synthase [Planctomycetota bacterium]MDA1140843.1 fused MFS/spermidine synthase [Planctomycetota bacterium]